MQMDPRCKRLNALSDQYHQLFRHMAEKYLEQACLERKYKEKLCLGDFLLLYEVGEGGNKAVSMADISRKLSINPSTATRRVNRLLADGMITKEGARFDERRYDLYLTREGRELLEHMERLLYEMVQFVYQPVSEDEMQTVYRYMEKCIGQLKLLISQSAAEKTGGTEKDEQ